MATEKQQPPPTQGVCIIALNHPYYGNYAAQLAASLLFSTPDLKIALLHDNKGIGHLRPERLALFSNIIEIPQNCYYQNGRFQFLKAKAHLYELSPFDATIYLDADMLWLPRKPISELFTILNNFDFTMANRGAIDVSQATPGFINWATPKDIETAYGCGVLYNLSSEFIYFKKTPETKEYFKKTIQNFATLKVNHMQFAGGIPDELPFAIAILQTGTMPHVSPFLPSYWEQFFNKNLQPSLMYEQYYAYSLGGSIQNNNAKKFYNNLANFYCNKLGIGQYFPLISKRSWLPERANI